MAWTSVVFPVPSSPDSPITAGARSARPNSSPNRLSSSSRHRMADRVPLGLELENLIAQHRRQLEVRSEEHTSELLSLAYLVCRLLLEKKKKKTITEVRRKKKEDECKLPSS